MIVPGPAVVRLKAPEITPLTVKTLDAVVVAMVLSLVVIGVRGFNYGVDFKGGTMIEVQSKSGPADVTELRSRLGKLVLVGPGTTADHVAHPREEIAEDVGADDRLAGDDAGIALDAAALDAGGGRQDHGWLLGGWGAGSWTRHVVIPRAQWNGRAAISWFGKASREAWPS